MRPRRLFGFNGPAGGEPSSRFGLEAPGGHGLPPATASRTIPDDGESKLQGGPRRGGGGRRREDLARSAPSRPLAVLPPKGGERHGGAHAALRSVPHCP